MSAAGDAYDLSRFVEAQAPVWDRVLAELAAGRKRSHWMWFVFPQIAGLGSSPTAQYYAIGTTAEARAYLDHAMLGPRLVECTRLVNAVEGRSALEIFGTPDELKFRSSMTLFARVAQGGENAFEQALAKYFGGDADPLTVELLESS